ncbi:S-adenosyl-L-methionine-dependent methyltransferase [Thozetella sp. PMI_491]|nr:S-adenosyl-L-methionine-dependent methyltransferase [Thozetella sp. PMI_491]
MTDTDFFHSQKNGYWDTYLAARPDYTRSEFFERLFDYHREHGNGSFHRAHDVACGPGNVAAVLKQHFQAVTASDANGEHVEVARQRLAQAEGPAETAFVQCMGEDITAHEKPGSLDLITVAEAIALLEMPKALSSFAEVLKPGGTIALWFYGRPHFVTSTAKSAPLDLAANTAYRDLANFMFQPLIERNPAGWAKPTRHMHSWFDDVAIPDDAWTSVRRFKWNGDTELPFYSPNAGGLDGKVGDSAVGPHETLSAQVDRTLWGKTWNASDARTFLEVNMPVFNPELLQSDEGLRLFRQLEQALGGEGVKKPIAWPVVLILAVKK